MKGFVNIFKPLNMTSSDVVVKVRGILRNATGEKQKVGHLGTLDPLAAGVLPIAVGNATRLFDYMLNKQKKYITTFKFASTTDTLDRGGRFTQTDNKTVKKKEVINAIPALLGDVLQMPPQYSAKTVNGRRAYDIAREGGIADLKPKKVSIYSIDLLGCPNENVKLPCDVFTVDRHTDIKDFNYILSENEYAFKITCGSGTYIRSIVRDMAECIGTVGYMTSLCRIYTGDFSLENAITLQEFDSNPLKFILPVDVALDKCDKIYLNEADGAKVLNGIRIPCEQCITAPVAVYVADSLVGLGEVNSGRLSLKTRL